MGETKAEMIGFPKEQHVLNLINEAVVQVSMLGDNYGAEIGPAFSRARAALETSVSAKHHLPLVLSAARRHIVHAEKHTVARIIGDDPVSQQQMSDLVHVRLICAELLPLLTHALDGLKASRR